jgi:hypothetical protein
MKTERLILASLAATLSSPVRASVPPGAPLGVVLGEALLGLPPGIGLPLAGSGLLLVAAGGLVLGTRIARRKRQARP